VLVTGVAVLGAGCGLPTDDEPDTLALPAEFASDATTTSTSTTLAPEVETDTHTIFFVKGDRLESVSRTLPSGESTALDVLEQVVAGPTEEEQAAGLSTAIPVGTEVLRSPQSGRGVMTLDMNEAFQAGVEGQQRILATAQLLFTATALPQSPLSVRFQENGEWRQLADQDGVLQPIDPETGVPEPFTRADFSSLILSE
jgi:spore germination protein GerM